MMADKASEETMKNELEKAGYKFKTVRYGNSSSEYLIAPNGEKYHISHDFMKLAYAHMQKERELKDLRLDGD